MNNQNVARKRAAIYCRVASSDQNHRSSNGQIMELRKYAARRGLEVHTIYLDEGFSSQSIDRPGLNALRAEITKGKVNIVLSTHPHRLARNVALSIALMKEFQRVGVKTLYSHLPEAENYTEQFMDCVLWATAAFEHGVRAERIRNGLRRRK